MITAQNLQSVQTVYLPTSAQRWVVMLGLWSDKTDKMVWMDAHPNEGGRLIYDPRQMLPAVAMYYPNKKVYPLTSVLLERRNQDTSDLMWYFEMYDFATKKQDRDDETCNLIVSIEKRLLQPLRQELTIAELAGFGSGIAIPELRRMKNTAMFTACTIWREGRQR